MKYRHLKFAAIILPLLTMCGYMQAQAAPASQTAPSAAAPQATTPATPPLSEADAKKIAAAKELVGLLDIGTMFKNIFNIMSKTIIPLIARDNPNQNERIQKLAFDTVSKVFTSHMDEIANNKAIVYANLYTYDELEQIITFYKSAVGQKMIKTIPEAMEQSMALDKDVMTLAMRESMQQLVDELKKNNMKVPREMGI